jgi:hypothetical protein
VKETLETIRFNQAFGLLYKMILVEFGRRLGIIDIHIAMELEGSETVTGLLEDSLNDLELFYGS